MEAKESFVGKKSELIALIKSSKMSSPEKEAWLNLVEEMLEQEIEEFIQILKDEEGALKNIETKYQEKIQRIKTDFNQQWDEFVEKANHEIDKVEKNKIQTTEAEEIEKLRQKLQTQQTTPKQQ